MHKGYSHNDRRPQREHSLTFLKAISRNGVAMNNYHGTTGSINSSLSGTSRDPPHNITHQYNNEDMDSGSCYDNGDDFYIVDEEEEEEDGEYYSTNGHYSKPEMSSANDSPFVEGSGYSSSSSIVNRDFYHDSPSYSPRLNYWPSSPNIDHHPVPSRRVWPVGDIQPAIKNRLGGATTNQFKVGINGDKRERNSQSSYGSSNEHYHGSDNVVSNSPHGASIAPRTARSGIHRPYQSHQGDRFPGKRSSGSHVSNTNKRAKMSQYEDPQRGSSRFPTVTKRRDGPNQHMFPPPKRPRSLPDNRSENCNHSYRGPHKRGRSSYTGTPGRHERCHGDRSRTGPPWKRQKLYDEDPNEFTWNIDEMKLVTTREGHSITRDSAVVENIKKFIRSAKACSDPHAMTVLLDIFLICIGDISSSNRGHHGFEFMEEIGIFDEDCHISFWGGLSLITRSSPVFENEDSTCKLVTHLCKFAEILFDHWKTKVASLVPLDDLHGALIQLYDTDKTYASNTEIIDALLLLRNNLRKRSQSDIILPFEQGAHTSDKLEFVQNFLLTPSNLDFKGYSCKLKPNIVVGKYPSELEYLETHFELLKEDFSYPLRTALHSVRTSSQGQLQKQRDYYYYKNVRLVGKDISNYSLVYKMKFEMPVSGSEGRSSQKRKRERQINWERCKQFSFGSLVCLSNDGFHRHMIFASVAERKLSDLKYNIISICLAASDSLSNRADEVYEMIESPSYLEAYAPVLARLSHLIRNPNDLAMKRYLVNYDLETEVLPPVYLNSINADEPKQLDLSTVVCGCEKKSECTHVDEYSTVDVSDDSFWSDLESPVLDSSQQDALQLALKSEVALIQGPPGTGKTFIGLKLVEILLRNRAIYTSSSCRHQPIVIMCYTNHALDQFLEEILNLRLSKGITIDIVRLGGRSKSNALKEFTLHKKLILARKDQKTKKKQRRYHVRTNLPRLQAQCDALEDLCESKDYCVVNEELYFSFLHPEEVRELEYQYEVMEVHDQLQIEDILHWFGIEIKTENQDEESADVAQHDRRRNKGHGNEGQGNGPRNEERPRNERYRNADRQRPRGGEGYTDHQAIEDDRNEKADNQSKGSAIVDKAANGRRDLTKLFQKIQSAQAVCRDVCRRSSYREKIEFFKYCLEQRLKMLKKEKALLLEQKKAVDADEKNLAISVLKSADIIGVTTTGASTNNHILTKVRSKIVIIEEAAEIMEAHVIAALTSHTQHLVMIGDHKQLRPKPNDYYIGKEYKLEVSLFERLIRNKFPYVTLEEQHRMRPAISQLIQPHIYNKLTDHESVQEYPIIKGITENVFFINHREPENEAADSSSHSNDHEASFMAALCLYLLQQGYNQSEITMLTPYTGQVYCLRDHFKQLSKDLNRMGISGDCGVRIVPIDQYQGEENKIILLSLVRSGKPGFVKESNRICVALSRAKHGLYCIGNFDLFSKESDLWKSIVDSVRKKGFYGTHLVLKCQPHGVMNRVSKASEFESVPEGGCTKVCGVRRQCGHLCDTKCHPYDEDLPHPGECTKPCIKQCKAGLHPCKLKCNEPCTCDELVKKKMPSCNHTQMVECDIEPRKYVCQEPCEKQLGCGHKCQAKCGEPCTKDCGMYIKDTLPCGHHAQRKCCESKTERMKSCAVKCDVELNCGHKCSGDCSKCNQGRIHVLCKQMKCGRVLPLCGHICKEFCSQFCPPCKEKCPISCPHGECGHACGKDPCIECAEPCQWNCKHYQCNKPCGALCVRPRCDKPCLKLLPCQHKCMGLCSEKCPELCKKCDPDNDAFQVFLGREDEKDARFIQLYDCNHTFEVTDLDNFMDSNNGENEVISFKKCPRCSTMIHHPPLRYCNNIKTLKRDMNAIKKKQSSSNKPEKAKIIEEIIKMSSKVDRYFKKDFKMQSLNSYSIQELQKHQILLRALSLDCRETKEIVQSTTITPSAADSSTSSQQSLSDKLITEFSRIEWQLKQLQSIVNRQQFRASKYLPLQAANDIQRETQRLSLSLNYFKLSANIVKQDITLSNEDEELLKQIMMEVNPDNFKPCFKTDTTEERVAELRCIEEKYNVSGISEEEIMAVIEAIDAKKGSWYKCPNGHLYNIGQCGGAMEEGRCPECGEAIGGRNHQLLESNTHDGIVDGSQHMQHMEGRSQHDEF